MEKIGRCNKNSLFYAPKSFTYFRKRLCRFSNFFNMHIESKSLPMLEQLELIKFYLENLSIKFL